MKTRTLRGMTVTELGFGGASLGNLYRETSGAEARVAVDAAWDGAVRYYDTAPHYGLGLSERRLGGALAGRPRDGYILSTKVGRLLEPNAAPSGSDLASGGFAVPDDLVRRFDFSRDGVLRSLESSLRRLGVSRVDIAYVHDPDEHVDQAVTEAIPALADLRDQGVIGAVGVGTNQWQAPLRMIRETDLDVVMLAGRWTLLDRSGAPLLAACAERDVAVVAAAPYNSGLLARDWPEADMHFDYGRQMRVRCRSRMRSSSHVLGSFRKMSGASLHEEIRGLAARVARRQGLPLLITPDTILRWPRDIGRRRRGASPSAARPAGHPPEYQSPRPPAGPGNPEWGYHRIQGEPAGLGVKTAASTVWEILKNAGIDPAPRRTGPTWSQFLRSQPETILACDFFTADLLDGTQAYVVAVIEHAARRIRILLGSTASEGRLASAA